MVEAQAVNCPYCHKEVFFPVNVRSGYCSSCGRIIDIEGARNITVQSNYRPPSVSQSSASYARQFILGVLYSKRALSSYNTAVDLLIEGPVEKSTIVTNGNFQKFTLPEGHYKISARGYYQGGVNSQYVYGTIDVDLNRNRSIEITNGSSLFNNRLIIQFVKDK